MSSMPLPPLGGSPLVSISAQPSTQEKASDQAKEAHSFQNLLAQFNEDQLVAEQAVNDLVTGKSNDVQQVVMQVAKSEMSFRLFMEVRNQLIESYNEIMRMQF